MTKTATVQQLHHQVCTLVLVASQSFLILFVEKTAKKNKHIANSNRAAKIIMMGKMAANLPKNLPFFFSLTSFYFAKDHTAAL